MASRIRGLFRSIRFDEVLLLQGTPLMGAAFSMAAMSWEKIDELAFFLVANVSLVAHVFLFNDWAATAQRAEQPNKATALVYRGDITARLLFFFSIALLIVSIAVFCFLPRRTLMFAASYALLGIFYSHPAVNAKGTPVVSSLPHLAGGVLHFLVGYTLFAPLDRRGILIGLFFALTFTAGHLNHEVHDFEFDRHNNLRTNAVAFGKRPVFLASLALFTMAYGCLLLLALAGLVPRILALWPIVLYPLHLAGALSVLRRGITPEAVYWFRSRYRWIYGLIGAGILFALFGSGK